MPKKNSTRQNKASSLRNLAVVSLFSGAGGLDIAFCKTGRVSKLFCSDSHPVFLDTVTQNIPTHFPEVKHSYLVKDARDLKSSHILDCVGRKTVDLVTGGPPCDDFTTYGKKRGLKGNKGPMIFEFTRLVSELSPKVFLFENVPSLRGMCPEAFDRLLDQFADAGYLTTTGILRASDFGAPTVRERLFVVGFRNRTHFDLFKFPNATHGTISQMQLFDQAAQLSAEVTVGDALDGLPDVSADGSSQFLNHTGRTHRAKTIEHMKTVPQGKSVRKSYRYRPAIDGLCRSLTAGVDHSTKSYLHPIYHREMSVREYARLHGFPDTWKFSGTHHNGIKQVANAVPIALGESIAECIVEVI